ncbi:hypothetical protein [Flavobacterium sp.]|jgi:hypothetical protein|uniref:hypothetical protein n=1 Tax=Flavobacterium sp. TaxID=239 RepID=UPI00286F1A75|nr:hypothetical protein [Flavobacterium sp.]
MIYNLPFFESFRKLIKEHSYFGNNKRLLELLGDGKDIDWRTLTQKEKYTAATITELINDIVSLLQKPIDELSNEVKKYTKILTSNETGFSYKRDYDDNIDDVNMLMINHYVDLKVIQTIKLKMVLKPEFLINTHTHNVTKHQYAILRILWIDNNLKKVRKFSTSLGNIETFGSIENIDPNLIKVEKEKLAQKIKALYAEEYP